MRIVSIVGCGYTGLRLAQRWLQRGAAVRGFAARAPSLAAIAALGAEARRLDLDAPPSTMDFDGQLVYYAVPPADGIGDPRLERFLAGLAGRPDRFVYLSTTGVYGDHAGGRVDEDMRPTPQSPRAVRRVAAEALVRNWAGRAGASWCILRVAGIYGPDRLPLDRLRRGEPAIEPAGATPGNRIHVDDLVTVCEAAGTRAAADRQIFNVTDGSDDSMTDFLQRVARIAGLNPPPLVSRTVAAATLPASLWSFLAESRRVDNRRMREVLGVLPAYADLDAGIRASLAAQG
jgi:nucleoside-diphosphate-sugar epimerase